MVRVSKHRASHSFGNLAFGVLGAPLALLALVATPAYVALVWPQGMLAFVVRDAVQHLTRLRGMVEQMPQAPPIRPC